MKIPYISRLKSILKNKEYKPLIENLASLSGLQIVGYILPLITLPYLVRVLGPEKYGLIAFAAALIAYFQILTDYGFILSATREISIHRDDKLKVSQIFNSVMFIRTILIIISFIILVSILMFFESFRQYWMVYIFSFGVVIGNLLFPVWFFQGMEKMKYISYINILSGVIYTISVFIFIRTASDFIYVPLLSSLGLIIVGFWSMYIIVHDFNVKLGIPKKEDVIFHFKDSTQFFLSTASVSIYTSSNAFFLGLFAGNLVVGYYSAAEKLYMAAKSLFSPLVMVVYPYMAKTKNKIFYKKIFKLGILINAVFCILLFAFSGILITILYGNNFQESINVLRIFCLVLFIVIPSMLLGYPFLAALGYQKYANASVIIGSIFHISALILISQIYSLNIYTVAVLVLISESIVLFLRAYGVKKHDLW